MMMISDHFKCLQHIKSFCDWFLYFDTFNVPVNLRVCTYNPSAEAWHQKRQERKERNLQLHTGDTEDFHTDVTNLPAEPSPSLSEAPEIIITVFSLDSSRSTLRTSFFSKPIQEDCVQCLKFSETWWTIEIICAMMTCFIRSCVESVLSFSVL